MMANVPSLDAALAALRKLMENDLDPKDAVIVVPEAEFPAWKKALPAPQ